MNPLHGTKYLVMKDYGKFEKMEFEYVEYVQFLNEILYFLGIEQLEIG